MITHKYVAGTTGPQDFRLLIDGVAADLTGKTVTLILTGRDGTVVDTTNDVSITGVTTGEVRYSPDSTDVPAANTPYTARWAVTDAAGKVVFFPSGAADRWNVFAQ